MHLKCSIQFRAHQCKTDVDKFYLRQLGTTKQLQDMSHEERLRELGLFNPEKRRFGDPQTAAPCL